MKILIWNGPNFIHIKSADIYIFDGDTAILPSISMTDTFIQIPPYIGKDSDSVVKIIDKESKIEIASMSVKKFVSIKYGYDTDFNVRNDLVILDSNDIKINVESPVEILKEQYIFEKAIIDNIQYTDDSKYKRKINICTITLKDAKGNLFEYSYKLKKQDWRIYKYNSIFTEYVVDKEFCFHDITKI